MMGVRVPSGWQNEGKRNYVEDEVKNYDKSIYEKDFVWKKNKVK